MRLSFALAALLLPLCVAAAPPAKKAPAKAAKVQRLERGSLVIENIPEIPAALAERTNQYQQTRGAVPQGWLGDTLLITTRFGDTSQIHRVAFPGGDRHQLTFFQEPIRSAAPAPDGRSFLFSKDRGGDQFYQIHQFDLATGSQRLLTDGKSRNQGALWSDKGSRFAFSTTRRNGKDTDIHVMAPGGDASQPLVEREGTWGAVDWSSDGSRLLVLKYVSITESELYVVDVAARAVTRFHPSDRPISFGDARFSHDGKGVYYTSDEDSEFQRLRYERLGGDGPRVLSADIPWDVEDFELSADGRHLAFLVNAGGVSELHVRDLRRDKAVAVPKLPVGLSGRGDR